MRIFKITYPLYLFALICMTLISCSETLWDENANDDSKQDETKLLFSLNMAQGTDNSTTVEEQNIDDVYIYAFDKENGFFIESVKNFIVSGKNGDKKRYIFGLLKNDYTSFTNGVEFILLVNLQEKGVTAPELTQSNTKADLYKELSYNYNYNTSWNFKDSVHYIPMWGTCSIDKIKEGVNKAEVALYRAIAKINVTLNGGVGFDHFSLKEIQVCNINKKGYCAPLDEDLNKPSIPIGTGKHTSISFTCSNDEKIGGIVDRIYIPEYKNINVASDDQSSLKIIGTLTTALGEKVEKYYTIPFKKNGTGDEFDVLRNNLYIFNITSISKDVEVENTLTYTVKKWNMITIDIPSFN